MSGRDTQIFELARQGLNAAEIAQALNYDTEVIEYVLANNVEIQNALVEAKANVMDSEFAMLEKLAFRTLKDVMSNGEKDSVRLAAAEYVIDQRLGLKKPKVEINVFSVPDFNEKLRLVRERRKELEANCVEVEANVVAA